MSLMTRTLRSVGLLVACALPGCSLDFDAFEGSTQESDVQYIDAAGHDDASVTFDVGGPARDAGPGGRDTGGPGTDGDGDGVADDVDNCPHAANADQADQDDDALAPSGSLKAGAREMGLYMQMLVNRGVTPDGTRIVSEKSLAEMWTPLLESYGLGWEMAKVDGQRLVSHTGAFDGFVSVIGLLPEEGVGFVLLVNDEEGGGDLTDAAAQEFAKIYSESK